MKKADLLTLHRWLALSFAPLLLLQALTGAALLFRGPLARAIDPAGMVATGHGATTTMASLAANAQARFPGYRLQRLFLPETPADTVLAEMADANGAARFVSLDPASAKVLAAGSVWRFPLQAALRWHHHLMDGSAGLAVVLGTGTALSLLAVSGLGFWWPGTRRTLKALKIPKTAPPRIRLRLWHRTVGVTASLILLFSSVSGVLLVSPDFAASIATAPASKAPETSLVRVDDALALARTQFPGSRVHDIRFSAADRIVVNFFAPERNPSALHIVSVALSNPAILDSIPAERNGVLWMKVLPLHSGDSFGTAGRLVLLGEALALVFLALSGPLTWWRARRRKHGSK